jgi:excisionase family DNA binding protein
LRIVATATRRSAPRTATERNDVSLPQRSASPVLARPAAQGRPLHTRPEGVRPGSAYPAAARPVADRPAPRAAVAFLTVAEVASIMRVSKMTVYRLVHGGELSAVRVGRSFRVPQPAVREYLAGARTDVA